MNKDFNKKRILIHDQSMEVSLNLIHVSPDKQNNCRMSDEGDMEVDMNQ